MGAMPRYARVLFVAIAMFALMIIGTAAMARRRPVLLSVAPDFDMTRPRNYCLMNPFRDREPEQVAEHFFQQLDKGQLNLLLAATASHPQSRREHILENETKWPIRQWRIGSRRDTKEEVRLMYWARRGNGYASGQDIEEEVYLVVEQSHGRAAVTGFDAIY